MLHQFEEYLHVFDSCVFFKPTEDAGRKPQRSQVKVSVTALSNKVVEADFTDAVVNVYFSLSTVLGTCSVSELWVTESLVGELNSETELDDELEDTGSVFEAVDAGAADLATAS